MKKTRIFYSFVMFYVVFAMCITSVLAVFAITQPTVYAENITANAGDTVSIPVKISNNTGIAGFGINLTYDTAALTPLSVNSDDSVFSNGLMNDTISSANTGVVSVIWSGSSNVTADGILFTITFKVNEEATGSTVVGIDYDQRNTFDENIDDVALACSNTMLTIKNSAYDDIPKIVLSATNATVGEPISVTGIVSNIKESGTYKVDFSYDSNNFSFVSINSTVAPVSLVSSDNNHITFNITISGTTLNSKELFVIELKASDTATVGEYSFTAISSGIHIINCICEIIPSEASEAIIVKSNDIVGGLYGKKMVVPVYISNNKGIMGYKLRFNYDESVITPTNIVNTKLFPGILNNNIGNNDSFFDVMWNNVSEVAAQGEIFYIEFDVIATEKVTSTISISYIADDTFNERYESVTMLCENVPITLNAKIADLDLNGKIEKSDYNLLKGYIAGTAILNDYQLQLADIDNDNAIDGFDLYYLNKMVNGYSI